MNPEPAWYRQPGLACEFCGGPGHLIPLAPPPVSAVFENDDTASIETRVACPEHRFLVRNRAERQRDERRFAERDHGRPVLNDEPYPERIRRSLAALRERLGNADE